MESGRELTILSELSTVSIKNFPKELEVTFLPHLNSLVEIASAHQPPQTVVSQPDSLSILSEGIGNIQIRERSSVIDVSAPKSTSKNTERVLEIKQQPLEIVIEKAFDDDALTTLLRLVGEHSTTSINDQEARILANLLEQNKTFDALKIKKQGIRLIFRMPEKTFQALYHLPPIFPQFTGREAELTLLKEQRVNSQVITSGDTNTVAHIAGTGGIGKSQLANHHARQQFKEKIYNWIVWFSGSGDEATTATNLHSQLLELGISFGLDVKELSESVLRQEIYKRLAARGRGLLVFDDVPDYALVREILPEDLDSKQMDVLVTTRNSLTFGSNVNRITLDVFTLPDAKRYIQRVLNNSVSDADVELLAITLGCYPLAITQALAYIIDNVSIAEFCERYNAYQLARAHYLNVPVLGDDPYALDNQGRKRNHAATMRVVVDLSLERVRSLCYAESTEAYEQSTTILNASAYLAPETAIPKRLLTKWVESDPAELKLNFALETLRRLSLIEEGGERFSYRMHQVVQDVLKAKEKSEIMFKRLLRWPVLLNSFKAPTREKKAKQIENDLFTVKPHAMALSNQLTEVLRNSESSEQTEGSSFPKDLLLEAEAATCSIVASACNHSGEQNTALQYLERALKCVQKISSQNLGSILYKIDISTASQRIKDSHEAMSPNVLKSTKDIAVALLKTEIGGALLHCGYSGRAKIILQEALVVLEDAYGHERLSVSDCLNALGLAMLECGDLNEGQKSIEQALKIYRKFVDYKSKDLGIRIMNLGLVELRTGKAKEALMNFKEALEIFRADYGDNHVNVAACLTNLGGAAISCYQWQVAISALEEAFSIIKEIRHENHPSIAACLMNLGWARACRGEVQLGKENLEQALSIMKGNSRDDLRELGLCMRTLGCVKVLCKDPQGGILEINNALPLLEASYGKAHLEVRRCLAIIGMLRLVRGNEQDATRIFSEVSPIFKAAVIGVNDAEIGKIVFSYGVTKLENGNLEEARRIFAEAIMILKRFPGDLRVEVGKCLMNLGSAENGCGNLEEGVRHLEEALSTLLTVLNRRHVDVGRCMMNLGTALMTAGNPQKAILRFLHALPILRSNLTEQNIEVATCLGNLGVALQSTADYPGAVAAFTDALPIFRNVLANNHPKVVFCLQSIESARQKANSQSVGNIRSRFGLWTAFSPTDAICQATAVGTTNELNDLLTSFPQFMNQPDQIPHRGFTPLHCAVIHNRPGQLEVLLNKIGFILCKDVSGKTPIDYAIEKNNIQMLKCFKIALLKHYSNHHIDDSNLQRLVLICSQLGDVEALKLLKYFKVDFNYTEDEMHQTALHHAIIRGHTGCIRVLLEGGSNPQAENTKGETPISLAVNHSNFQELLRSQKLVWGQVLK